MSTECAHSIPLFLKLAAVLSPKMLLCFLKKMANQKIEALPTEINSIQDQLSIIQTENGQDLDAYKFAIDMVHKLQNFCSAINPPSNQNSHCVNYFLEI
jgi:hypothetical protein